MSTDFMTQFKFQLLIIYAFLVVLGIFFIPFAWAYQTNPFVSYIGGKWTWFALSLGAGFLIVIAGLGLARGSSFAPKSITAIAWLVIGVYLLSTVPLLIVMVPNLIKGINIDLFITFSIKPTVLAMLAVSALIIIRSKEFVLSYPSTDNQSIDPAKNNKQ